MSYHRLYTEGSQIDTWNYYENDDVIAAVKAAGFGEFKMREKGKNTFAVFNARDLDILGTVEVRV